MASAAAQVVPQEATLRIRVSSDGKPVAAAIIRIGDVKQETDAEGRVSVKLPAGRHAIVAEKDGYLPAHADIDLKDGLIESLDLVLQKRPDVEEAVTVSSTRTGGRLEDTPTRVEVLNKEEIEEKTLMTPGDIVMMLNEMGGLRVQTTSPGLGAATVRVQGLRGRYTRFFSDGLPLFGDVGGIGLLQIPPMDLGQVEVIKGVASSLYGAGAMGGVVNLVSRQPSAEPEHEFLINRSTRGATDAVGWLATPAAVGWAATLIGGGHWQSQNDLNADTWSDLAGYSRGVVRPRVFWTNGAGASFFGTVGYMFEDRNGGTIGNAILPPAGVPYEEGLASQRIDGGFVGQVLVNERALVTMRGALSEQRHHHVFGENREDDTHRSAFAELTMRRSWGPHVFVAGAALEREEYRSQQIAQFDYRHWIPGAFAQADLELRQWLSISGSARFDHHGAYGSFLSPRVSMLVRKNGWISRVSAGGGFLGPTPLTEETEAAGLSRLSIPIALQAERGRSVSADLTRMQGPFTVTITGFGSRIAHPVHVDRTNGLVMTNLAEPAKTAGLELLGTFRRAPFSVTGTYGLVRAHEILEGTAEDVPLTPRHSAGLVGMWEREGVGRVGVECYVTGAQRLEDNPYRDRSRPYVIVGVLAERRWGKFSLFVNGENLTNVRQTRYDPLIRPTRAGDGRWTVDAWAPLDGVNVNGGIRVFVR
jgi:outer membrane receptor for ferrienterochelin and colicins